MSDTAYNVFQHYGTHAARLAFTPSPGATGQPIYLWYETDTGSTFLYDTTWHTLSTSAPGTVTNTGTLTANALIIGNGGADVKVTTTGTGILTALGINVGSAGAPVTNGGALGTPSSGTLTNASGLPAGTGLTGKIATSNVNVGGVVQVVNTETGAVATGTTLIPTDDTIPQNTEGDQYMTLAITPTSATNKLKIEVITFSTSSVATTIATALFQDTTANAIATSATYQGTGTGFVNAMVTHYMTSGTTSPTTFKVRIGGGNAGTVTFNGAAAARYYGGVLASSITITEIQQ